MDQPLLSKAVRNFHLDFSILHGQINEIRCPAFGSLAILANCTNENIQAAIAYLTSQGVTLEELNHLI